MDQSNFSERQSSCTDVLKGQLVRSESEVILVSKLYSRSCSSETRDRRDTSIAYEYIGIVEQGDKWLRSYKIINISYSDSFFIGTEKIRSAIINMPIIKGQLHDMKQVQ